MAMRKGLVVFCIIYLVGCSCSQDNGLPVDPDRTYYKKVKSDCTFFLRARVRDKEDLEKIANLPRFDNVEHLQRAMSSLGIRLDLSKLRYKIIAKNDGIKDIDESKVVSLFLQAAKELYEVANVTTPPTNKRRS